ncbi:MAG TPA: SH3 domain-containing protein [Stellaceae bacterium]|nr:SH3 domain-containing protein [Stellaceae bacterium]
MAYRLAAVSIATALWMVPSGAATAADPATGTKPQTTTKPAVHKAAPPTPQPPPPPAADTAAPDASASDPGAADPTDKLGADKSASTKPKPARDKPPMAVRYATIKFKEVNVRVGPGPTYPINWVFKRKDMPVEVVAEFGNYRKIRDWEGSEGWVTLTQLNARRGVIIQGEIRTLHREASAAAQPVARVEPGVIGRLLECPAGDWCRVEIDDMRGWINRSEIWGVTPAETVP